MRLEPKTCANPTKQGRLRKACQRSISSKGTPVAHHYVVVRDDLPPGLAAAMIVHAAGETYLPAYKDYSAIHAVVLVADRNELSRLSTLTVDDPLPYLKAHPIHEPDPPFFGALLAIAWRPSQNKELRKALRHLKLYGKGPA